MTIPVFKMNGLGNEILIVDARDRQGAISAGKAVEIARTPGLHFDQLMLLGAPRTPGTLAYMTIYNTDGSPAQSCGNGTRCVAAYLNQITGSARIGLQSVAGLFDCTIQTDGRVSVDMGCPRFAWQDIPLVEAFHDTRSIELQVGPIDKPLLHSPSVVNVGNPHCIFWVERLDIVDLGKIGPMLEHHRLFPERANISLARIASPEAIELKVWERGAGLTKACGTAACAAAVAAARKGLTTRRVRVTLPGGPLDIDWREDDHILMIGPVEFESRHQLEDGILDVAPNPG